ncbi:MAG TPA: YetF domain-containing protein [Tepidisphaeraceae bacterium]|nr:YetF domain-containing protein [Tepidisphaeraceae bacterium]
MEKMWTLSLPWWEFVLRAAIVYLFLLLLLRLSGKRQAAQITQFDLVLVLLLSNAVQNSMNGGDSSALGGMISAVTLIAINYLVGYATRHSRRIEFIVEGSPKVLVRDGKVFWDVMRRTNVTQEELQEAARGQDCETIAHIHLATLENSGRISILPMRDKPT